MTKIDKVEIRVPSNNDPCRVAHRTVLLLWLMQRCKFLTEKDRNPVAEQLHAALMRLEAEDRQHIIRDVFIADLDKYARQ